MLPSDVAIVDVRRQVQLLSPTGRATYLTGEGGVAWGAWSSAPSKAELHSWPTWSPSGKSIACLRVSRDDSGNRVLVTDARGVSSTEVGDLQRRMPIYLRWSPDGRRIAALSQDEDVLKLTVCRADTPGAGETLLAGSPLFFAWADDSHIASFIRETGEQPTMLVTSVDDGRRCELPGRPGNFCAPIVLGDRIAYVAHEAGRASLRTADWRGGDAEELERIDGLAAILPSPDNRTLACAVAKDGSGVPYRELHVVDTITGRSRRLRDAACQAFFWLPDGSALVTASRGSAGGARATSATGPVTWSILPLDGAPRPLHVQQPSRDSRFYLRFFEQYAPSHPIVDASSKTLLLCGTPPDTDPTEGRNPRLVLVPVDGSPPEELGEALFGCFAPRPKETP